MLLQEAIKLRILELAAERGYSVNKLAERSGIAPSALKKKLLSLMQQLKTLQLS